MKRVIKIWLATAVMGMVCGSALADTIYVKLGSTGDGSSWASAYGDFQASLSAATYGDEIWVAAGTYKPEGDPFQMKNGVGVYGGFPDIGDPTFNDRDPRIYETILSGDIGTPDDNTDNCRVFHNNDLDPNAVLDGFIITGGYASSGGGMYNNNSNPTINNCTFTGNTTWRGRDGRDSFGYSEATSGGNGGKGAGMYNQNSSPIVTNCTFNDNATGNGGKGGNGVSRWISQRGASGGTGGDGAGMYNHDSSPTLINCEFLNNITGNGGNGGSNNWDSYYSYERAGNGGRSGYGAGMYNDISSPTMVNCIFKSNANGRGGNGANCESSWSKPSCRAGHGGSGGDGAGIYNDNSSATIVNCTFNDNRIGYGGTGGQGCRWGGILDGSHGSRGTAGGMYNANSSSPEVTNCIFWGDFGGEIYDSSSSPTVNFSDVQGGYPGNGNIDLNPFFEVPECSTFYLYLDLSSTSPCIDAGDNTAVPGYVVTDLDGRSRFIDNPYTNDTGNGTPPIVDMGAYEYNPLARVRYTGSGTAEDPYQIWTAAEFDAIHCNQGDWDKHFRLMNDIDLGGYAYATAVIAPVQGIPFTGVFDGAGKMIFNLTIDATGQSNNFLGLFGRISGEQAQVKNLGLENVSIVGGDNSYYLGGLCGENRGTISECYVIGRVSGDSFLGGLCGRNSEGKIRNCYTISLVTGDDYLGGLCGQNNGTISSCYAAGPVAGDSFVGGLCGSSDRIVYCSFWDLETCGIPTSAGGVGKTTAEMMDANTYASWGDNTWTIDSGNDYPHLMWENQPGIPIIHSGRSCDPGDPVLLGSMYFYYEYSLEGLIFGGWSPPPPEESFEASSCLYEEDDDCPSPDFSWSVNGQLIMSNHYGYSEEELLSLLTSGRDEYIDFSMDWPPCDWIYGCECFPCGLGSFVPCVTYYYGYSEGPYTPGVYGPDLAGHEITKIKVEYGPVNGGSWVDCPPFWGWDCWYYAYYVQVITVEIYGRFMPFFAGSGTEEDPYQIWSAEELNEIGRYAVYWDKHFILMADIDLSGFDGREGRPDFNIIAPDTDASKSGFQGLPFVGVFDGNGHAISNFTYFSTDKDYIGIFGRIQGDNVQIRNLGLIDSNVNAGTGHCVGSLVGDLRGNISECYAQDGIVVGANDIGGLVGYSNDGSISNCYSSISVIGEDFVGGLLGYSNNGIFSYCYSTASVLGTQNAGCLIGFSSGHVSNSYWDVNSASPDNGIGIPKTTAEMMMADTFVYWGICDDVWTINEGVDYPRLFWEHKPGEPLVDEIPLQGDGDPNSPILIYTAEELNVIGQISCLWDKHFKVMADIDLSGYIGTEFSIIGNGRTKFTGVFDGDHHTISNFTYDSNGINNVGLFGYVDDPNAEIKSLGLIDPNINVGKGRYIGSLVGYLSKGTIVNCYLENGSISGDDYVGGLMGYNKNGVIEDCSSTGDVNGEGTVGGLVGNNHGTITNSNAAGQVNGSSSVGGLVGYVYNGIITSCYSTGDVNGINNVGGFVGYIYKYTITNCYSTGDVNGVSNVGGLVGYNSRGTITNCYATGAVEGDNYLGGLCGRNYLGSLSQCFWDIDLGGPDNGLGTPLPTAQMQTASTFIDAEWDFNTPVWTIDDGNDYPHLWWELVLVLHAEPEVTLRTINTIYWDPVPGANDYYVECAEDADFAGIVYNSGWITETSCEFTGLEVGKRYWYSVKARNSAGTETNWSNVESSLQCTLAGAVKIKLDPENLKNANMKNALLSKIDEALEMIEEGLYQDALNKFRNDILQKTNGCAGTGDPDNNDWIITCEEQSEIYPLIIETIAHIRNLMDQSLD